MFADKLISKNGLIVIQQLHEHDRIFSELRAKYSVDEKQGPIYTNKLLVQRVPG